MLMDQRNVDDDTNAGLLISRSFNKTARCLSWASLRPSLVFLMTGRAAKQRAHI